MKPDFAKNNGLVPVIIQDFVTLQVLMLGYMNEEAFDKTIQENKITFFSRSKNRLWTKGETSGNYLNVEKFYLDCDRDTLLFLVKPVENVCHTGSFSCFGTKENKGFIYQLEKTISKKIESNDSSSYTNTLFKKGINKMAQKVGEESVELIIEAKDNNQKLFINEAADLMYHLLILLKAKNCRFEDIEAVLLSRSKNT
jgi:phosphoribosyl-AMP cyclohydrolase / phosphoribosyl-ATP pyrophosphohydrolase